MLPGNLLPQSSKSERVLDQALVTSPSYLVFYSFFDQTDSLEHVGDIVDSTLLHFKSLWRLIKVDLFGRWTLNNVNEALCKFSQAIVNPILLNGNNLIPVDVCVKNASSSLQNHTLRIRALVPRDDSRWQTSNGNDRSLP